MMKTSLLSLCLLALTAPGLLAQGAPTPYIENFDLLPNATSLGCASTTNGGLPTGWMLDPTTTNAWHCDSGGTSSVATGPSIDNTTGTATGNYLYTETSCSTATWIAILNVLPLDTTTLSLPTCEFAYHMYGATMGTLELQEFDGVSWITIWSLSGDQGDQWLRAAIPVTSSSNLQLRFVGTRGTSFTSDMAIDDFAVKEPTPRSWEINEPAATLTVDGISNVDPFAAASAMSRSQQFSCNAIQFVTGNIAVSSNVPNALYEIGFMPSAPIAAGSGALVTAGGQYINLNFGSPSLGFVNGGLSPVFLAGPGFGLPGNAGFAFSAPYSFPAPITLGMQLVCTDPSAIDGFAVSSASGIEASVQPAPTTIPLTLAGNAAVTIDLAANCLAPGGVAFSGTRYTSLSVISNGRIMFGGSDTDLSPSLADALRDLPFVGLWTDLNPGGGGSVALNAVNPTVFRIDYTNVPYNGTSVLCTFGIEFDTVNDTVKIDGLNNIMPNPGLLTGGDSMFLGLSPGAAALATDPGATPFTLGGSGQTVANSDMLYDFNDPGVTGVGLPASLMGTGLNSLTFFPLAAGMPGYLWAGL